MEMDVYIYRYVHWSVHEGLHSRLHLGRVKSTLVVAKVGQYHPPCT